MATSILKELIPPIVVKMAKRALVQSGLRARSQIEFSGNFSSWDEALKNSTGYDSPAIAQKIESELRKVIDGKAFYERDSVAFQEEAHPWAMTSLLLRIALEKKMAGLAPRVSVIDFGGSLGSSYFHVKKSLPDQVELSWHVIELPGLIEVGRRQFENRELQFHSEMESIKESADIFLLCSTLQYLPRPYEFLERFVAMKVPYFFLERTPLLFGDQDRLTVQKVSPDIYPASYPAWFLSQKKVFQVIEKQYQKLMSLRGPFDAPARWTLGNQTVEDVGYVFKVKA